MAVSKHLKILVFVDWYLPGYKAGGPIRSVANLVQRLPFDFSIVTSDRDHMDDAPYAKVKTGQWVAGPFRERVMYLPADQMTRAKVKRLMREVDYDFVYINSLFSPRFAILPLRVARKYLGSKKVLLAPRGMLKGGALSQKSRKKQMFLRVARLMNLFSGIRWHATNDQEKHEILEHFPGADVRVAPNLVVIDRDEFRPRLKKEVGSVKLVSVARVSPEKNVLKAVEYLQASKSAAGSIELKWFGTQQDADYLKQCKSAATKVEHAEVSFPGEIAPQRIPSVLADAHFFYLPTLGENYGHAIVEAFVHGKPVLISDRTPWRELKEGGMGWDLPLDAALFAETLNQLVAMDDEEYAGMVHKATTLGKEIAGNTHDLRSNYALFDA